MAIKKTELYSSLWASCDELRGGMDASQYKDYVLTLLFMKYVSDKYAGDPYAMIMVPEGGSFEDMVALKGNKEVGDNINKIIGALAEENDLKGVIDVADFNDEDKLGRGKEMVDRLSNLVGIFDGLDLSANRAEGDDLLGDAYEYLMRHFATESGKSKGQFYTPAEVSRVLAKVVGITTKTRQDQTVYDPTCGSGSLLLKVADEAPNGLTIYGQEMDNSTWALARMNMFMHGYPTHEIWRGNTLSDPHWKNMVDASRGFMKDGNKNRLRSQDIHKIVDVFNHQTQLDRYSRLVPLAEIEKNDYNLNIPRYIDASEPEDIHDLAAHLSGGIPNGDLDALNAYWQVFPQVRNALFAPGDRSGYSQSLVEASRVKATILNHPEFEAFAERTLALYTDWYKAHIAEMKGIGVEDKPKVLIATLSEDLLRRFTEADLLDRYDIYQILMDYWAETMQDDVYVLVQDGWGAGKILRELVVKKGEKLKEIPYLTLGKKKYKADLIPPELIVARYFADKQAHIDELQADLDGISQELESLIEEHSGEEGLLSEAQTDTGKVTKTTVTARLKEIKQEPDADEEKEMLKQCLELFEQETKAKATVKQAQEALDQAVFAQYPKISEAEVKTLVVEDKWHGTLKAAISAEIERVTQQLANRVKDLEERYAEPLPELVQTVEGLSSRVEEHLKKMGLVWH